MTVLAVATPNCAIAAQERGVELFHLMGREPLARISGTTRLQWLPGGGHLERASDSGSRSETFFRVDPATGGREPLFDRATVTRLAAAYQALTGRPTAGLPFTQFNYESGGRALGFSVQGERFVYDLGEGEIRRLIVPSKTGPLDLATREPGRWSPDFNRFAFIRDYDNLYLFDPRTGKDEQLVTGSSEDNLVGFLGAGPWFVWSPDSRRIAYLKADQHVLAKYPVLRGLERKATVDWFRYPFTSDSNPRLELWVVDLESRRHVKLAASTVERPYIRDIEWLPDGNEVTFQLVDRWESRLELNAADPASGRVRTILVDQDSTYLNPPTFRVLSDGKRLLWASEQTGWRHLYLHDLEGYGKPPKQLTTGDWEFADVLRVDEQRGWIYFTGYTQLGRDRNLYRVRLDGTHLTRLTPDDGYHTVSMDSTASYFLDDYSSLSAPRSVSLRTADGKLVRQLATTDTTRIHQLGLEPPELLSVKGADGVTEIQGLLFKPVGFDPAKRYPVVVMVYGGPHSKQNFDTYETVDFRARVAQLGFLVAEFDVRGTPYRGKRFQSGNYLRLGQPDVDDQAGAVKQLASRPYVDGTRVGITGISHGGYMTLMALLRYPDVYHVGVSGAPITDVANGPRQYIGRFMRTPQANPEGYDKANVLRYVDNLKGHLLIAHGTNDRNAVLGNTSQLLKKLVDAGKPVDLMIYPDGVHVFEGRDAAHYYKLMLGYFVEHLKPDGWEHTLAAIWKN